jgi:hypothetical protein
VRRAAAAAAVDWWGALSSTRAPSATSAWAAAKPGLGCHRSPGTPCLASRDPCGHPAPGRRVVTSCSSYVVAVRVVEGGERAVADAISCGPGVPLARVSLELCDRRPRLEHLADLGAAGGE